MLPETLPAPLETALATGRSQDVLEAALIHFGCQAGTIHVWRGGVLRLVAHKNIPPPVVQIVETVPLGKGIAGLAAERKEAVTICNLQTDDSGQARPGARATGMEGSLAVPMLVGGALRGVFGIAKAGAYDWSSTEIDVLLRIGSTLAESFPAE